METGLKGRTVLITGASGGIGWGTAELFHREGCQLVLHAGTRRAELAARVDAAGWDALVTEADVRNLTQVDAMFQAAVGRFGGVDVCVANAGVWPPERLRIADLPEERVRDTLEVNLLGSFWTARSFMRQVSATKRQGSALVLVGSTAGRFGEAGHAEYSAAKAGLRGLMLSYKNEIVEIDRAGRCNLVEPGWTVTPMAEGSLDDQTVARVTATMPLKRIATVADVASAIVYFASPQLATHLTGQTLVVAGGMEGRLLS
jgi:3-oxoacyl-[acyl-carrier protein] reductase